MNHNQVFKKCGKNEELAKKLCLAKGIFVPDLNFTEWVDAYSNAESGSPQEFLALKQLIKSGTFENWINLYEDEGILKEKALIQMVKLARTFKHWEFLWRTGEDMVQEKANKQMIKLGIFEDWLEIYLNALVSDTEDFAFEQMVRLLD